MATLSEIVEKAGAVRYFTIRDECEHGPVYNFMEFFPEVAEAHTTVHVGIEMFRVPWLPKPIEVERYGIKIRAMTCMRDEVPFYDSQHIVKSLHDMYGNSEYIKLQRYLNLMFVMMAETPIDLELFVVKMHEEHYAPKKPDVSQTLFFWSTQHNRYIRKEKAKGMPLANLRGLDDIYQRIVVLVNNHSENAEIFEKLGVISGLNVLLHGPPGVGKTSIVRALTFEMGLPVYMGTLKGCTEEDIPKIMSPRVDTLSIVFVEDFDRAMVKTDKMSALLNALDGMAQSPLIIRIFSANDPSVIRNNTAMASRMAEIIKFPYPEPEHMVDHIASVFTRAPRSACERFVAKITAYSAKITIRNINFYMIRFIKWRNDPDPERALMEMEAGADAWLDQLFA
jgi:hypothetical protein